MTSPRRSVVLVGYGLGGRVFHAPLLAATAGLSLDAIVTSNPERQAQARTAYPGVRIYATADEAWSGGHDLAVITTANVTHVDYATAALESGTDVVLDKPIAGTAAEAKKLAELAADRGRLLVPFQNRRWDSDFLTVMRVAASGRIGTVHRFESRLERMRVVPRGGWRDSNDPADLGGQLYDLGAHVIDQALVLLGPVTTVTASVRSVRVPEAPDDDVTVLLTHEAGGVSVLTVSVASAFAAPRQVIFGTRGGLRVDAADSQEAALAAGLTPGPDWGVEPAGTEAALRVYDDASEVVESAEPLLPGRWPHFYAAVERALGREGPAPVLIDDVVQDMRVLDAARESAATGGVIRLEPPAGHRAASTS